MMKTSLTLLILLTFSASADQNFSKAKRSLTIEGDNQEIFTLDNKSDYFIQPVNDVKDEAHLWYRTIKLVDEDGAPLDNKEYKVSANYLYRSISHETSKTFQAKAGSKEVTVPKNSKVIIDSRGGTNWKYYNIYLVNNNGQIVDEKGKIVKDPKNMEYLKVSESVLDQMLLDEEINSVSENLKEFDATLEPPKKECVECEKFAEVAATRSVETPPVQTNEKMQQDVASYDYIMNRRNQLKGTKGCETKLRQLEQSIPNQLWDNMSIEQRASEVYNQAKISYDKIKNHKASINGRGVQTNFAQRANPHYLHPGVTPELMSCIVFQETHGIIRPQVYNYTYCDRTANPTSTAHGLGMITSSTMKKLHSYKKTRSEVVNQIPITTIPGNPYNGKSATYLHKAMADDVPLTMEVIFRTLNDNLKQQNWSLARSKSFDQNSLAQTIKQGVTLYDQDAKSGYLNGVLNKCLPCMQQVARGNGNAIDCHNRMKK